MTMREYYDDYWRREAPAPVDDQHFALRLDLLQQELRRSGARRVLDAGCGHGATVAAVAAGGVETVGIDISPQAIERARSAHPGLSFHVHSVEETPWPVAAESQDLVYAFEVIEHLVRPRRLLEGARDALAAGGRVVLTTPYHGRLKNVALALLHFDEHFAVEGDHIRFFSDGALRRLLEEVGFDDVRFSHYGRVAGLWAGVLVSARRR